MAATDTQKLTSLSALKIGANIRGLIFDYGGTLDSRGDHWSHIILDAYRANGLEIPTDSFIEAYVYAERALAARPHIAPDDTFCELMRKKIGIEMDWLLNAGHITIQDIKKSVDIAEYCYNHARECVAESAQTLRKLAEKYSLVLVSNFYGNINAVISDFGIDSYFKAVIESAVVGVRKPDPEIFNLGLKALGLPAEDVLVVGDSLSKDILPALSLGCPTALLAGRPWPPR